MMTCYIHISIIYSTQHIYIYRYSIHILAYTHSIILLFPHYLYTSIEHSDDSMTISSTKHIAFFLGKRCVVCIDPEGCWISPVPSVKWRRLWQPRDPRLRWWALDRGRPKEWWWGEMNGNLWLCWMAGDFGERFASWDILVPLATHVEPILPFTVSPCLCAACTWSYEILGRCKLASNSDLFYCDTKTSTQDELAVPRKILK